MAEVHLSSVRVALPTNTPVVLLREVGGERTLPIYIGTVEATAIAYAIQQIETPRPMTHDLVIQIIESLAGRVDHISIDDLQGDTFFAEIHLEQDNRFLTVSSRPSDAIAIAVRTGAPIFVDDGLLDSEGVVIDEDAVDGEASADEVVAQFREFINDVKPEDFDQG